MLYMGHRGLSGSYPENSTAAFKACVEHKVNWVETDANLLADGIWVLWHDEDFDRCSDGEGLLSNKDWSYAKSLDIGSWFDCQFKNERVLKLDTALRLFQTLNISVNLEIKSQHIADNLLALQIVEHINQAQIPLSDIMLSSFNLELLLEVGKINPSIKLGWLSDKPSDIAKLKEQPEKIKKLSSFHPHHSICSQQVVKYCHTQNLAVHVWTVNDKKTAKEMDKMNVDGLMGDHPQKFASWLEETSKK